MVPDSESTALGLEYFVQQGDELWNASDAELVEHIFTKWGRLPGKARLTDEYMAKHTKYKTIKAFAKAFIEMKAEIKDVPELKPFFRLHPPRKGHMRNGIKRPYTISGALGYRGEAITALVEKMS